MDPVEPSMDIQDDDHDHDNLAANGRKIARKGKADPTEWKRNAKALNRMHGVRRQMKECDCQCCRLKER